MVPSHPASAPTPPRPASVRNAEQQPIVRHEGAQHLTPAAVAEAASSRQYGNPSEHLTKSINQPLRHHIPVRPVLPGALVTAVIPFRSAATAKSVWRQTTASTD
ncbi:hypothetical protein AAHC03_022512 [Spirometra sp. Aus1]